ncbi:hypothetical protein HOF92_00855 [bacterium]|nr:hypothetical protein [bacterium]
MSLFIVVSASNEQNFEGTGPPWKDLFPKPRDELWNARANLWRHVAHAMTLPSRDLQGLFQASGKELRDRRKLMEEFPHQPTAPGFLRYKAPWIKAMMKFGREQQKQDLIARGIYLLSPGFGVTQLSEWIPIDPLSQMSFVAGLGQIREFWRKEIPSILLRNQNKETKILNLSEDSEDNILKSPTLRSQVLSIALTTQGQTARTGISKLFELAPDQTMNWILKILDRNATGMEQIDQCASESGFTLTSCDLNTLTLAI